MPPRPDQPRLVEQLDTTDAPYGDLDDTVETGFAQPEHRSQHCGALLVGRSGTATANRKVPVGVLPAHVGQCEERDVGAPVGAVAVQDVRRGAACVV